MKTSNKILLAAISIIGLSMLSILIFAKSSLITIDQKKVQGNGIIIKMDYPIEDVALLEVDEFFEVHISIGDPKLEIETDENIQALLRASTDNYHRNNSDEEYRRVLKVEKMNSVNISPTQAIRLFLALPTLERIDVDNHAKVIFEEIVTSEKFEIEADEFSTLDLKLDTKDLHIDADNHSTITIDGNIGETMIDANEFATLNIKEIDAKNVNLNLSNHVEVALSGKADFLSCTTNEFCEINAKDMVAQEVEIRANNNSNLSVHAVQNLKVNANEHVTVDYRGTPEINKFLDKTASVNPIE